MQNAENEYERYFRYLHVFSPFAPTMYPEWLERPEDENTVVQTKKDLRSLACVVCEKALFFGGAIVWEENNIRVRLDSLGRPHLIIYSVIHEEHQPAALEWNPVLIVKMSKCIDSVTRHFNIKNFSVEYRHGEWNTHKKVVYWRLMMGAPDYVDKFYVHIKNKKVWCDAYNSWISKSAAKMKRWGAEEKKQILK